MWNDIHLQIKFRMNPHWDTLAGDDAITTLYITQEEKYINNICNGCDRTFFNTYCSCLWHPQFLIIEFYGFAYICTHTHHIIYIYIYGCVCVSNLVPIVQEAGWAPGPVWTCAKNLAPTGIQSPDRPAHSQLLYRLSYPAHTSSWTRVYILFYDARNYEPKIHHIYIYIYIYIYMEIT
jgi:hypothetical protein